MIDQKEILGFIKKQGLCVLTTASAGGKPEAATMACSVDDDLALFFFTEPETRKYPNLLENPQVSVVVGGWNDDPSIQIDGGVRLLNKEDGQKVKEFTLQQHPEWQGYFDSPTGRWFKIVTAWWRYSDFSQNPPLIVESQS